MRLEQPEFETFVASDGALAVRRASRSIVKVALSRRNLKILLAKLDGSPPNSACTIYYEGRDGKVLWVTAEEDDVHYANPERDLPRGGTMHPATEDAIA